MTALKPRNRVVVFRVTQDEYNCLKSACATAGGRNLSEFTRSELLTFIQTDSLGGVIQRRFSDLEQKLAELQLSLQTLARLVQNGSGENHRA